MSTNKKIFLISNMYPSTKHPGYGVFVKNVMEGMHSYGIDVVYSAYIQDQGTSPFQKLVKYIVFYWRILLHYFKKYDCIYLHFPILATPIVYLLLLIKRRPLVINYHGEDLLYEDYGKMKILLGRMTDKMVKKYANFIVVPSLYYRDLVVQRGLASMENIVVSPSGGINPIFNPHRDSHTTDTPLHLGFVGRLEEDKGILEFIEVAQKLLNESANVQFTIIGYGSLNAQVCKLIEGNPAFHLIFGIEQNELAAFYNKFDLFIFPSKRKTESLGLVGLEAMACGTPVIGSNIGGIATYLQDGVNGFLVSVDNLTEEITAAIHKYTHLSKEKQDYIKSNALHTAQLFMRETVCRNLAQEFQKRIN